MEIIRGTNNLILEVDISEKTLGIIEISKQMRKLYLGGKGLGLKLLYDRLRPNIKPLSEDNIIIFTTGVLIGTGAPNSARFSAVTKSPLTGIITSSSCGGPFGMALKTSGWDGLIIRGKAKTPTILRINSKGVEFIDGNNVWGLDTVRAQKEILKYGRGTLVIGQAGENLVRFANIASGHRFLGRGGMGAVLGSKMIKGIVALGNEYRIVPKNTVNFKRVVKRANSYIKSNDVTANLYRNYGTASNLDRCNDAGILPVRNFSDGSHKDSRLISGKFYKDNYQSEYSSCKQCSILCGHKGSFSLDENRKNIGLQIPEYETIGLLGANLEIFDAVKIAEWNDICSRTGIDTISLGGTLSWAMEAGEKGIYETELKFGNRDNISSVIHDIANKTGKNAELGEGVRYLSEKYGGKEFAIHVKGLEMGAYDPRGSIGMGLNYAVANRGACHLSTAVFSLEVFFNMLNPYTTKSKPQVIKYFENLNSAINSLHTCQFTAYAYTLEPFIVKYTPAFILKFFMENIPSIALKFIDTSIYSSLWSSITGMRLSEKDLLKAGERIHILERLINTREGISRKDDTLPERFLNESRKSDKEKSVVKLGGMLEKYYKIRGYDENGIPRKSLLKKLKIID